MYLSISVSESVYRSAGNLAEKHHLRGFDSLHLASYLSLNPGGAQQIEFSSSDEALNRAARKEVKERSAP